MPQSWSLQKQLLLPREILLAKLIQIDWAITPAHRLPKDEAQEKGREDWQRTLRSREGGMS